MRSISLILHQILCLAAVLSTAAGAASATDGTTPPLPRKCEGNPLADVLPLKSEMNGYRFSWISCGRGNAEVKYLAGKSFVRVRLMDTTSRVKSSHDAPVSDGMMAMFGKMGAHNLESAKSSKDTIKQLIAKWHADPGAFSAAGGIKFCPVILTLGGDEAWMTVPDKNNANGDSDAGAVLKERYLLTVEVKHGLAGVDIDAARQTIEPFLNVMHLEKLP